MQFWTKKWKEKNIKKDRSQLTKFMDDVGHVETKMFGKIDTIDKIDRKYEGDRLGGEGCT